MPQNIRIWAVTEDDGLREVAKSTLDSEARLEQWLSNDIGMIGDDLLVIGRQVETEYGGFLDFLCIDAQGDLIIVELKRDRTPRDVTAQVLDYASWVTHLSNDRITEISDEYLGDGGPLDAAFRERFNDDLPDTLNQSHRMLVVASEIDPSTERIVQYLSVAGIGVNVVTFEHFTNSDGSEMMGRVFLIEPEEVSARASAGSKRRPAATYEELNAIAHQNGVGGLYDNVIEGLGKVFDRRGTTRSSIAFKSRSGASINTIFSLIPGESNSQIGLHFQVYSHRLAEHLGIDVALVLPMLPNDSQDWVYYGSANDEGGHWTGYAGFFKTNTQVDAFLAALS